MAEFELSSRSPTSRANCARRSASSAPRTSTSRPCVGSWSPIRRSTPRSGPGWAASSACSGCRCPNPTAASAARSSTRPSRSRSWAHCWPAGPLFGTVYLAIPALVAASSGPARDELLNELVEGRRTAAFAVPDRAGAFDPPTVTVTASGDTLSGTVERVVDAGAADELLVAAKRPDGVALYAVDADGPGRRAHAARHARPDAAAGQRRVHRRARPADRRRRRGQRASSTTRCRWVRRCWRSNRSAPHSICSTCPSSTRSHGCSSAGPSDRSRRSSTGWPTCSSTSSTPAPPRTTQCGR